VKRAAALLLVLGAMALLRGLGHAEATDLHGLALALGFALIAAVLAGDLTRRLGLPRVTGYLLFGLLCGPAVANLITRPMARELQVFNGLAVALIGLIAGLELDMERLRARWRAIAGVSFGTVAVMYGGLLALLWAAWPWLPIQPEATGLVRVAMASITATIVASFSPIVTIAVVTDTRARGPFSEMILAVTLLADLVLVVIFGLSMEVVRTLLTETAVREAAVLAELAWGVLGSVAFGALLGGGFALYLRLVGRELTLVLLVLGIALSQLGRALAFEPILASITAGFVVRNVVVPQGTALGDAIARGALPVLVVFFAAAGASLNLEMLAGVGLFAAAVAAARLGLLRLGTHVGARVADLDPAHRGETWKGLVSQAGLTLGFAAMVAGEFPDWGVPLQAMAVALVAAHEIAGPVLFKSALVRTGETGPPARKPLIVVSNREPYTHAYRPDGSIHCPPAAGGVAVALDALMRQRGGVWIAHGSGDADRAVVDERDRVAVPPEQPSYALRRIWLGDEEFTRYYGGFANEGLWPLCHVVDVRPVFRAEDWAAYQHVNDRFAGAIDEELGDTTTPVFIQDYHLALVAARLRARRPQARTALFWHIPWPSSDRLRVCPWRREVLAGLLANDLLAFQVERDRRNFVMAATEELGAEPVFDEAVLALDGHRTTVVSVPIGVDYDRIQEIGADPGLGTERARLTRAFGLAAPLIGLGVDRLDYTKGIPERLAALDRLLTRRPELRGRLTFVQVGVPSRSELESYSAIESEIDEAVASVNRRHAVPGRALPVHYHKAALRIHSLVVLYRMAHFCVVSSLHDGMNLVAKEFVASRDDHRGVLVLSELAGAAQELRDALIINPYDVDGFASAMAAAVDMPLEEQARRMRSLRRIVAGRDVFNWASDIIEGLDSIWTKPLLYSSSTY
jgi:trehalose-6-phosphate synthase/Kef-type K+ transport system membrane component KefB